MALQNAPIPLYQKQGRVFVQRDEFDTYVLLENHGIGNITFPTSAPTPIGHSPHVPEQAQLWWI